MTKKYKVTKFEAEIEGQTYEFRGYTTYTRQGFCHTIECLSHNISNTKVSYFNRTWERFDYETCLKRAISKFPKSERETLYEILIERKSEEERKRCEGIFSAFKSMHESLTDESKERLANSGITMESEGDVKAVMGLMALEKIMN